MVERTVLQYHLVEKLGAGGMGEVYKARDTRLNRFVAMKVLPAALSADPERRRRFVHEAQAASALNHPNIITIYDIVSDGGTQYLVMEYVAGKTLLELIPKDGLPVPQAIQYASQMAEALSAAHTAGLIHRDLKPANIMVTSSGLVKLLDFGLAKLIGPTSVDDTARTATRIEAPLTVDGSMMGTVNYMSPEQAEGRALDARSDIFSFGAVLYEMVTGHRAFGGNSAISTLTAVLRDDSRPMVELAPDAPLELQRIVETCLRKDPDQRFQSMPDVQMALAPLKRQSDSGALFDVPTVRTSRSILPPPPVRPRASKAFALGVVLILGGAAAGGAYWWKTRHESPPPAAGSRSPAASAALTNDDVLKMVEAKVAPAVIVGQIRASKTNFNLSADEVIRLSKAGVPADILEVMRNPAIAIAPKPLPPPTIPVVLGDALPIRLTLATDIPSDATEGDAVRFRVADNVLVGDTVVIRRGAAAIGAIVDAPKRRIFGFGRRMTFRLERVNAVDGQKVTIRATQTRRRDGSSKRPVNAFAKSAGDVAAAAGTEYIGYTDGTNTVMVKKSE